MAGIRGGNMCRRADPSQVECVIRAAGSSALVEPHVLDAKLEFALDHHPCGQVSISGEDGASHVIKEKMGAGEYFGERSSS